VPPLALSVGSVFACHLVVRPSVELLCWSTDSGSWDSRRYEDTSAVHMFIHHGDGSRFEDNYCCGVAICTV
jgi:hypothetical protein